MNYEFIIYDFFNVGIKQHEAVPQCGERPAELEYEILFVEALRVARPVDGEEIPADRIRAAFPDHVLWINDIPFGLRHFLSFFIEHVSQRNYILIRRLASECGCNSKQGIKPPSCF